MKKPKELSLYEQIRFLIEAGEDIPEELHSCLGLIKKG